MIRVKHDDSSETFTLEILKRGYSLGSRWRGGLRYDVWTCPAGVMVSGYDAAFTRAVVREYFPRCGYGWGEREDANVMVNKYIAAVRERQAKDGKGAAASDETLCTGRPALDAFLRETDGGGGKIRERSVLMVAIDDGGVRVGLKDNDLGGWVWRHAATFVEALDALEKALTDPEASWRAGSGSKPYKRRKRR